jgi:hypothetical protein
VVLGVADAGFEVFLWNEGRWFGGRRTEAFDELDGLLAAEGMERVETELPGLWRFRAS